MEMDALIASATATLLAVAWKIMGLWSSGWWGDGSSASPCGCCIEPSPVS